MASTKDEYDSNISSQEKNEEPVCKKLKTESCHVENLLFNKECSFSATHSNYQSLHVLVPQSSHSHCLWTEKPGLPESEEVDCSIDLNGSCDSSGIADCDGTENSSEVHSEDCNTSPGAPCQSSLSDADPDVDYDDYSKHSLELVDGNDEFTETKPSKKRRVRFQTVQVYYFDRMQGFTCVPSQGGSTLGMKFEHWRQDDFPLTDYQRSRRQERRSILKKHYLQGKLQLCPEDQQMMEDVVNRSCMESGKITSSPIANGNDPVEDTELEERLSYLEEFYFLQPVSVKKRRKMLKEAGTSKIERSERMDCQDVRQSRELCGCDCPNGVCLPETCQCAKWNIQCQVDRSNFPCACTRQGCENPAGRLEFNPIRVKTHFIHTQMRLEMERHGYDPSSESSERTSLQDISNFNSTEQGSCRDCQNQSYMHAIVQELRTAGLLPSIAPPVLPLQQSSMNFLTTPEQQTPNRIMNPEEVTQVSNVYPASPMPVTSTIDNSYSDEDEDDEDVSTDEDEDSTTETNETLVHQSSKDLQQDFYYSPEHAHSVINSNENVTCHYQQFPKSNQEYLPCIPTNLNFNLFNGTQTNLNPHYTYCRLDPIDTLLQPACSQNDIESNLAPLFPTSSNRLTDLHYCTEEIAPILPVHAISQDSVCFSTSSPIHMDNSSIASFNESSNPNVCTNPTSLQSVSLGEILKKSIETTANGVIN